jgi:hypothetical protein
MTKIFALLSFGFGLSALAAPLAFDGEFVSPKHKVLFKTGYDMISCTEENGEWLEGSGCSFNGQNVVTVVKNGTTWFARVSTISPNTSLCDFEGEARQIAPNVLLATAEGEAFVPGQTSGGGSWVPSTCEVVITYNADGSVSAKEKDFRKCASFCGATGYLAIPKALRK